MAALKAIKKRGTLFSAIYLFEFDIFFRAISLAKVQIMYLLVSALTMIVQSLFV